MILASVATSHAGQVRDALPQTFDELSVVLPLGREIVVHDDAGGTRRGRVSEVRDGRIVIFSEGATPLLRMLRPARTYAFTAASVARIDAVDSSANGALIGAAVGAGVLYAFVRANRAELSTNNLALPVYLMIGAVSIGGGAVAGSVIDRRINRPIYQTASGSRRLTLTPVLAPAGAGVLAAFSFQCRASRRC